MVSILLPLILILVNSTIFKKITPSREKLRPFECGFDPKTLPRTPFSLKFYLISVIFLIFDIEIALILPIPLLLRVTNYISLAFLATAFFFILLIGLLFEWKEGALNWLY